MILPGCFLQERALPWLWGEGGKRGLLPLLLKSPSQSLRDAPQFPLKDKCPGPRGLQGDQQVAPEGAAPALVGGPQTLIPTPPGPWSTWRELARRGRLGGRHSLPCGVLSLTGGPGGPTAKRPSGHLDWGHIPISLDFSLPQFLST